MKLSLKKARKLENKIAARINDFVDVLETTREVRIKSTIDEATIKLDEAATFVKDRANLIVHLTKIRYGIRGDISSANHKSGINSTMCEIAMCESLIAILKNLPVRERPVRDEIKDTLEYKKKSLEEGNTSRASYRGSGVTTGFGFMTQEDVLLLASEIAVNEKNIESLKDILEEKNIKTKVEIIEENVKILEEAGLL